MSGRMRDRAHLSEGLVHVAEARGTDIDPVLVDGTETLVR